MSIRRSPRINNVISTENEYITKRRNKAVSTSEPPVKKSKCLNKNDEQKLTDESDDSNLQNVTSIYEFKAKDINGKELSLENYKGYVCIIANVASRCGHTKSNYEQFVEIFDKYATEKKIKILAFPCNQFGKQEPGDSKTICEFAKKKNVKFDVFEKIDVNGKNAHPLWKYLTANIPGPKGKKIDWNFTKFIVNKEGQVVERHKPSIKPLQMIKFLEQYW